MTAEGVREGFLAQVAQVAADRATAWSGLAEILGPPDDAVVARLRSGALVTQWRAGTQWLGDDSQVFTAVLMSLDVYVRGADRREETADALSYRADHEKHVGAGHSLAGEVRELAALCEQEAAAWSSGAMADGKERRARQHELLTDGLADRLLAIGADAGQGAATHLWRTLGKLILALVTVESGRDYQRAILGDSRASRRPGG